MTTIRFERLNCFGKILALNGVLFITSYDIGFVIEPINIAAPSELGVVVSAVINCCKGIWVETPIVIVSAIYPMSASARAPLLTQYSGERRVKAFVLVAIIVGRDIVNFARVKVIGINRCRTNRAIDVLATTCECCT